MALGFFPLLLFLKINLYKTATLTLTSYQEKGFVQDCCIPGYDIWTTLFPGTTDVTPALRIPATPAANLSQMANKVNVHGSWPNCRALQRL